METVLIVLAVISGICMFAAPPRQRDCDCCSDRDDEWKDSDAEWID